jgi:4'-phosphopantetheinyl transferase
MHPVKLYWLECNSVDLPADTEWLTPLESAHWRELHFPKRRADWLLGRWTAKCALANFLGSEPHLSVLRQIEIRRTPSGAPEAFVDGANSRASVSISHSHQRALAVVAPRSSALGCDLEMIESRMDVFVNDFFTQPEIETVARCAGADERHAATTLIWSAKESALKLLRVGLTADTRSVEVQIEHGGIPASQWRRMRVNAVDGRSFSGWWLRSDDWMRTIVTDLRSSLPSALKASKLT